MSDARATWSVSGQSVRGSSHIARDMPNEDAVAWTGGAGTVPLVFAVSDGHGSATSFRSAHGSRIAVDAACDVLSRERTAGMDAAALGGVKRRILELWQTRVSGHAAANPLEPDEVRLVGVTELTGTDLHLAYGATLLAVSIDRDAITYLQIGDGDVLCVAEDGTTTRRFPHDPSMALHETHSLCEPDADLEMRAVVVPQADEWPAAILAATDGYLNSFASDRDFLQIGHDYLELLRTDGLEHVRAGLAGTLKETSDAGSHDDITLAIAERVTPSLASEAAPRAPAFAPPPARAGDLPATPPAAEPGPRGRSAAAEGRPPYGIVAALAILVVAAIAFAAFERGRLTAPAPMAAPSLVPAVPAPVLPEQTAPETPERTNAAPPGRKPLPKDAAGAAKTSAPAAAEAPELRAETAPAYAPAAGEPSAAGRTHVDSKPHAERTQDP